MMMTTKLVVQSGQYEQSGMWVDVRGATRLGVLRRARQLSLTHAVHGDNFAGWLPARIAIAHPDDVWTRNIMIGGANCEPVNGWMDLGRG